MSDPFRSMPTLILTVMAAASLVACGGNDDPPPAPAAAQITTLSNRADLVSGGDVLVELVLPTVSTDGLKVDVDGRDVTAAFTTQGTRLIGLVEGLKNGANVITASAANASAATLTVTNTSRGGPVISGAQIVPFFCATPVPVGATGAAPATNASGLTTAATDAQCNIATEYQLYYRTTTAGCSGALPDPSPNVAFTSTTPPAAGTPPANPCYKVYNPTAAAPADLATTTTDAGGAAVPYIVRVERGTMNRGIYDIAVLFDPTKPWTASAPQAQWNRKVYYQFGASTGQPRRQLRPATAWSGAHTQLARGYAVVANSMTDSLQNSNRVMMTETVMMMKEHITDRYGEIKFTMGTGCSGGSINSNMNASIAPGQLDGITISCAYPDSETTGIEVGDCVTLVEAYQKPAWQTLMTTAAYTPAQINAKKGAINGHPDQTGCHGWYNAFGSNAKAGTYFRRSVADNVTGAIVTASTSTNNCQLPTAMVYDPLSNVNGARCNAASWAESIYGKAAGSVAGNDARDNTGVQYGLKALLTGAITGEEFVTLNEIAGGVDRDTNLTAARSNADRPALDIAYRAGIVTSGKQLAKTAVIDMRGWDDTALVTQPGTAQPPGNPIHFVWRSFSIRERLDLEYGDHGNQVIWRFGRGGLVSPALAPDAFATMDTWLTTLKADASAATVAQKVRTAKPAAAFDFCLLSTDAAQTTKVTDTAVCDADPFLKASSSPRQAAGGKLSENVLKCDLRAINAVEYGGRLDAGQITRLQGVFPGGVCDWSKPGIGQQAAVSPLTFAAGPGGVPLPAAPMSKAK